MAGTHTGPRLLPSLGPFFSFAVETFHSTRVSLRLLLARGGAVSPCCSPRGRGPGRWRPASHAGARAHATFDLPADTWRINHAHRLALSGAYVMERGRVEGRDLRNTWSRECALSS